MSPRTVATGWLVPCLARLAAGLMAAVLVACGGEPTPAGTPATLRLATTTSTYDSGLLTEILASFEQSANVRVDVIAVGTGQALSLARRGDADVLLVHAPVKEQALVDEGHGLTRIPVMYNDFVVLGPTGDPAGAADAKTAAEALTRVLSGGGEFVSRGDNSGTHTRELSIWKQADHSPEGETYLAIGQGMGATLTFANERRAYTLSDRGTYLSQRERLGDLVIVFGGDSLASNPDPALRNPYSVIRIDPAKHEGVQARAGQEFVKWLTSEDTQARISEFGKERFAQPLFFPDSEPWRAAQTDRK